MFVMGTSSPDLCVLESSPLEQVLKRYKPGGIISPQHLPSRSSSGSSGRHFLGPASFQLLLSMLLDAIQESVDSVVLILVSYRLL